MAKDRKALEKISNIILDVDEIRDDLSEENATFLDNALDKILEIVTNAFEDEDEED